MELSINLWKMEKKGKDQKMAKKKKKKEEGRSMKGEHIELLLLC